MARSENIIQEFLKAAALHPWRTALSQDEQSLTYEALLQGVHTTAGAFQRKGIRQGDKVLVFVPLSPDLYRIVLALFYLGAVPVFLDEWVSRRRLKACCKVVPCVAIIASPALLALSWLLGPLRKIRLKLSSRSNYHSAAYPPDPAHCNAMDTALVTFTTGSTGTPKAADRTHAFLQAQLTALKPLLSEQYQWALVLLPVVVLVNLALGKSTLLPPRSYRQQKPETLHHLTMAAARQHPQIVIVSPAIGAAIALEQPQALQAARQIITGGGPVLPDVAALLCAAFPQATITAVYGSTEAEPISHIAAQAIAVDDGLIASKGIPVGLPDAAAQVCIIPYTAAAIGGMDGAAFAALKCPAGTAGEIIVSGPHVLEQYLNNPAAIAATKIKAATITWHRTGDCGRLDAQGALYFLGRCNEQFTWKGHIIYPVVTAFLLKKECGAKDVAVLLYKGKPVVIVAGNDARQAAAMQPCLAHNNLSGARILSVPAIPKDPRHRTKTDDARLRHILARQVR